MEEIFGLFVSGYLFLSLRMFCLQVLPITRVEESLFWKKLCFLRIFQDQKVSLFNGTSTIVKARQI